MFDSCQSFFHFNCITNRYQPFPNMPTDIPPVNKEALMQNDHNDSSLSTSKSSPTKSSTIAIDDTEVMEGDEEVEVIVGGKRSSSNSAAAGGSVKKANSACVGVKEFGMPRNVHNFCIEGKYLTAAAFVHFCELYCHYSKTYHFGNVPADPSVDDDVKKSKGSKMKQTALFSGRVDKKTFENICPLCLCIAPKEPNAPHDAWTAALCKVKNNLSNANKHLCNKHPAKPKTIMYLANNHAKKEEKRAKGVLMSSNLSKEFAKFTKSKLEILCNKMINWLIACGMPHVALQMEEFNEMFQ